MSDLRQRLARLGLSQYLDAFTAEGFDTWETVLDITESDLSLLNVKLGHRRKLQRAIAESRGQTSDRPLPISLGRAGSAEASYRSGDESATETNRKQGETNTNGAGVKGTATKRKYRRHPKPDEHAPERPPSAYVIFSNQIRELLKGQELSFTEIAKVVGERWQVLPAEERETCERQANTAKEKYYAELADYKKTPQYEAYQKYLEDFKAKHAVPTKGPYYHCMPPSITELTGLEGKRSKLETETSTSTRSSSHDQHERASNRRLSEVQPDPSLLGLQGTEASPPIVPGRLPPGSSFLSKPTSPASHATLNSPRTIDHYSPISASPRSSLFDISSAIPSRDSRGPPEANYPYLPSAYSHPPMQQPASTTPPSYPSTTRYQAPLDLPSRRSMREPTRLPPLTREDTTWSSESGQSGSGYSITPSLFPGSVLPLDPQKTMRMLPQPVPSIGPLASLDRPPPAQLAQLSGHPPDYRTQGSLAALVRAGELAARVADEEAMDVEGSSISP